MEGGRDEGREARGRRHEKKGYMKGAIDRWMKGIYTVWWEEVGDGRECRKSRERHGGRKAWGSEGLKEGRILGRGGMCWNEGNRKGWNEIGSGFPEAKGFSEILVL